MATTAVRERPILFSGEMVRAILDGRKTQTRRVMNPQPADGYVCDIPDELCGTNPWIFIHQELTTAVDGHLHICKLGQPGDRLWVRESFTEEDTDLGPVLVYRADKSQRVVGWTDELGDHICGNADWWQQNEETRWKPSIHMPRWASRITLEITEVRVQRIQEITEADVLAEGVTLGDGVWSGSTRRAFMDLWDRINSNRGYSWESNPWVWALTFKKL